MELVTRASQAAAAAMRWDRQYPPGKRSEANSRVSARLHALGVLPCPADVDWAIRSEFPTAGDWACVPDCLECGATDLPAVVRCGQEPDYESCTAWLCETCLEKAAALVRGL